MDQHYFLVCPVNSQNKEKLAGQGEARLRLLTNATYLAQAVDMHQFIRCQIARGIHCSTEHAEYHHCSTSRRGEEPSARFIVVRVVLLLEPHGGAFVLLFLFISDKVHVYSGEGRKTAAQHVMNDIDQPTMLEYILAFVRARLCVLAPRACLVHD